MRNILLLISMLGLLPAGCGRTVSDTDTVSCDTFVYSVKGGDSLRLDRYTDTPAAEIDAKKPCMIFVFGGAFISGTRDAESYRPFFEYMAREQGYTVVSIDYRLRPEKAPPPPRQKKPLKLWQRRIDISSLISPLPNAREVASPSHLQSIRSSWFMNLMKCPVR